MSLEKKVWQTLYFNYILGKFKIKFKRNLTTKNPAIQLNIKCTMKNKGIRFKNYFLNILSHAVVLKYCHIRKMSPF